MTDCETTTELQASPIFNCDEVSAGLFQGNFPDGDVDWSLFDDFVTMTANLPSARVGPGGLWLHIPIWDGEMENPSGVRDAARTAADRVIAGRRVLIRSWAGLNRSGVVSARALMFMGVPARAAIRAVRAARGSNALFNAHFVEWLYEEAGDGDGAHEPTTTGG